MKLSKTKNLPWKLRVVLQKINWTWTFGSEPEEKAKAEKLANDYLRSGMRFVDEGKTYFYPPHAILEIVLFQKEEKET